MLRDLNSFSPDIAHIFNMQTLEESSEYVQEAKLLGAKVVLSTDLLGHEPCTIY